jgi:hypothetical protein
MSRPAISRLGIFGGWKSGGASTVALPPNAVREEVERAMQLISYQPRIGQRANDVRLPNVRRIHLARIWHYLYYRINDSPEQIELLALWSESRGKGPPI